jgi:hypothetical protein
MFNKIDARRWMEVSLDDLEHVAGGGLVVDPGQSGGDCTPDNPNGDYTSPSWKEVPDQQEGPDQEDIDLGEIDAAD